MTVNEIQFGLIPSRGTIDAVFILRRLQEEHHAKKRIKLQKCFVDTEKAFAEFQRNR